MSFLNKLWIALLFTVVILPLSCNVSAALASPIDVNGGVMNEYEYKEIFFLTGTPTEFSGKAVITEKENKGTVTRNYRFTLTSKAGDKLTRSVNYVATINEHEGKGQTTSQFEVKSYSEKVTFGKRTYTLADFQYSEGSVSDNLPASSFYSGNMVGRKIYKFVDTEIKDNVGYDITVHLHGRNMGYKNFWGATETQLIDSEIITPNGSGLVTSKASDSKSRVLVYEPFDPSLSSFTGGHSVVSSSDMVSEYTYNIPFGAGSGTIELQKKNTPKIERLIVPKFRDLDRHQAKDAIQKLYSLGIFDENSQFFSPNTPMKRYQYTVGILKAVDLRVLEEPKKSKVPRVPIFADLSTKDPDYMYIESAVEQGIITGVTPDSFEPDSPITRVQAIAILVRALGMEGRAPSPGFKTQYVDDYKISDWAKDSVYVATELGLVRGNEHNQFNPKQQLTRAQAALITSRFLDFLENDLKQNYRDDIFFQ
ncbi:S-layer homology domain-containing protein [Sporosarcina sp. PTS2304]|uniref:S-layer homology domain-containing protein n=1 Tax=Sporosarcina sp. PTS2304 TaxID=2283194 RepID=UPI000E0DA983|nr:S-layer homology domain-containing protein [Sporosarcina sp. PTS2304]AXH98342.1 S-layer homology domain-containing protein [Sporosarcina sp. PTS2304]